MKKEVLVSILECLFVFSIIFLFNLIIFNMDTVWEFTQSFSVSNGLILYKDFNMVAGPVYPVVVSLFLFLFGKNFIVFNIVNSLFVSIVYFFIRRLNYKTLSLFIILLFLHALINSYNIGILLLFYIIYYLEKRHVDSDYFIGVLISLSLFTKINMGVFMILPTLFLYYKVPKKILKRAIACILTSLFVLLIMLVVGNFSYFFDYTILGLFSFGNKNFYIEYSFLFFYIGVLILLFFHIKRDRFLIYQLCFSFVAFPSFDSYHIFLAIFPSVVYFFDLIPQRKNTRIIVIVMSIILFFCYFGYFDNKIHVFSNFNNKYQCFNFCSDGFKTAHKVNRYLKKNGYSNYKNVYLFNRLSYYVKLDSSSDIDKYDLILNGNMGYHGEDRYIKAINRNCKHQKCIFIIKKSDLIESGHMSRRILNYVVHNYHKKEDLKYEKVTLSVYEN